MFKNFKGTQHLESLLEYPKEYNPRVHGPYNPAIYYGKPDPLSQVKVGEIGDWFARRNMSFRSIGQALTRASWRYRMKYTLPKKAGATIVYHFIAVAFTFGYFFSEDYKNKRQHTWAKYH